MIVTRRRAPDDAHVKPRAFQAHRPASLDEAVDLLGELGEDANVLAGGQSLVPMMNLRIADAAHLVDINRASDLDYVRRDNGQLRIGTLTRQRVLEGHPDVASAFPLGAECIGHVGYPATRARGTVGGSVAHADPAGELGCALIAAGGSVVLASRGGSRELPAEELFLGPYMTAREPGELLAEVRVPAPQPGTAFAFEEFARKRGDFGLVLVAVALGISGGTCSWVRIALGGAVAAPERLPEAEAVVTGEPPAAAVFAHAAAAAAREIDPMADVHGSGDYRRRLVEVHVRRALAEAARRAGEGEEVR
jgi:CO/xanthine dehydrogenase FAD-binding subunit